VRYHDRMTGAPNLDHACQKRFVVNDQALLGRFLREPQATRINLGNVEWLRAMSGTHSAKILCELLPTYNIRLLLARISMAWA